MAVNLEEVAERVKQHPRLIFADDFEIAAETQRTRACRRQNGKPVSETADESFWLSLRVLHRKAPGVAVVTASDESSLSQLVEGAFQSARASTGDPWFRFPIWKRPASETKPPRPVLPETSLWSGDVPDIAFVEEKYEARETQLLLRRKTERLALKGARSLFSAHFSAASDHAAGVMLLREERANRHGAEGMGAVLRTLAEDTRLFGAAEAGVPKGKASVLFSPAVASALLAKLSPWFFSDRLRHHKSPLRGQDPKHVFSPVLTLLDVGNHPESPYSGDFDYEGTLTRETTLVERGALRNLLFDTYEATRENRLSTGNWLKSPGASWPSVQVSTCCFRPAEQSPEALVQEAGHGVWLRRVESLEPLGEGSTRFQLKASGYLIENGVDGPARRGISLQFDAFELLRKAVGIGSDLTLFGTHGSPSILFEKVPLGDV